MEIFLGSSSIFFKKNIFSKSCDFVECFLIFYGLGDGYFDFFSSKSRKILCAKMRFPHFCIGKIKSCYPIGN